MIPPLSYPSTHYPYLITIFVACLSQFFTIFSNRTLMCPIINEQLYLKIKDKKCDFDFWFWMNWNIHGSLPLDVLSPNKIILRWVKIDWELPFMPPKSVKTSPIVDNVLLDQYIRVLYTQWNLITWNKTFLAVQPLDVISTPASANS